MIINSRDELNVYLFGVPRFMSGSQDVHLQRRKMYGLLAYLAFGKRQLHRDTLADLFWPDHDTAHFHGSLCMLLSELQKILDPGILPVKNKLIDPIDPEESTIELYESIRHNRRVNMKESDFFKSL
jgi:two-component SAPR family response regulator